MENWDYALLSQRAKEVGGPEVYVNQLIEQGRQMGRREAWKEVGLGASAAAAVTLIICAVAYMAKKKKAEAEIERLKAELIRGIKEYDKQQEKIKSAERTKEDQPTNLTVGCHVEKE